MASASSTAKPTPAYQVKFDDKGHVLQLSGNGKSTITTRSKDGKEKTFLYARLINHTQSENMKFSARVSETQTPCLKAHNTKTKIDSKTEEKNKPKILKQNKYIDIADAFTQVHANPSNYFPTISGDLFQDDSQILLQRTQALKELVPGNSFTVAYIESSTTHPAFLTFILEDKQVVVKNIQSFSDTVVGDFVVCGVESKTEIQNTTVRLTHVKDLKKNTNHQQPIVSQAQDIKIEEIIHKIMSEQDADFGTKLDQLAILEEKPRKVCKTSSQGHDSEMGKTISRTEVQKSVETELAEVKLKKVTAELKTKEDALKSLTNNVQEHTSTLNREQIKAIKDDSTEVKKLKQELTNQKQELTKQKQELKRLKELSKQMPTTLSTYGPSAPPPPPPPMGAGAPPPPPPPPEIKRQKAAPLAKLIAEQRERKGKSSLEIVENEKKDDFREQLMKTINGERVLKPVPPRESAVTPDNPKLPPWATLSRIVKTQRISTGKTEDSKEKAVTLTGPQVLKKRGSVTSTTSSTSSTTNETTIETTSESAVRKTKPDVPVKPAVLVKSGAVTKKGASTKKKPLAPPSAIKQN